MLSEPAVEGAKKRRKVGCVLDTGASAPFSLRSGEPFNLATVSTGVLATGGTALVGSKHVGFRSTGVAVTADFRAH